MHGVRHACLVHCIPGVQQVATACLILQLAMVTNAAAKDSIEDQLHRHKAKGGSNATRDVATMLADRHFDLHGTKWPTKAFVDAMSSAAPAAGLQPASTRRQPLALMAMANELALHVTVPLFVRCLHQSAHTSIFLHQFPQEPPLIF